jgi:hypothetical protein
MGIISFHTWSWKDLESLLRIAWALVRGWRFAVRIWIAWEMLRSSEIFVGEDEMLPGLRDLLEVGIQAPDNNPVTFTIGSPIYCGASCFISSTSETREFGGTPGYLYVRLSSEDLE